MPDRDADMESMGSYIGELESSAEWAKSPRLSKEEWLAICGRAWDRAPFVEDDPPTPAEEQA